MYLLHAALLGVIQGLTEFLPVSSSGHLAAIQELLRIDGADLLFDVMLHLGTLTAVCFYYRRDLRQLLSELFVVLRLKKRKHDPAAGAMQRRLLAFLVIGTVPMLLAFFVKDFTAALYHDLFFVAFALIVNGAILFFSDRFGRGTKTIRKMTVSDALLIGLSQLIAVFPGISRSGATISSGLFRGLDRRFAVTFSFLLSIPAILGATVAAAADAISTGVDWSLLPAGVLGMALSAIIGYFALQLISRLSRRGTFGGFAFYCWGAGAVILFLALIT